MKKILQLLDASYLCGKVFLISAMSSIRAAFLIKTILAAAGLTLIGHLAVAQQDPADCSRIKDNTQRLVCYDKSAQGGWPNSLNWSGSGNKSLPPFSMSGSWTLHWSSEASDGLSVFVYTDPLYTQGADDPSSSTPGEDESYETANGNIYLRIVASGPWKVWIRTGD